MADEARCVHVDLNADYVTWDAFLAHLAVVLPYFAERFHHAPAVGILHTHSFTYTPDPDYLEPGDDPTPFPVLTVTLELRDPQALAAALRGT